jgi:hypothetical protein
MDNPQPYFLVFAGAWIDARHRNLLEVVMSRPRVRVRPTT